jgi:prefoldin subunit 5
MNTDERLEQLRERHEALAQSAELLHASLQELREIVLAHDRYMSTLMSAATKLLETATNHERRLMRLEGPSQA